jgi:hypothetical protein
MMQAILGRRLVVCCQFRPLRCPATRSVAKQKKSVAKQFRNAIGQQLNYLKCNLGDIERMTDSQQICSVP